MVLLLTTKCIIDHNNRWYNIFFLICSDIEYCPFITYNFKISLHIFIGLKFKINELNLILFEFKNDIFFH